MYIFQWLRSVVFSAVPENCRPFKKVSDALWKCSVVFSWFSCSISLFYAISFRAMSVTIRLSNFDPIRVDLDESKRSAKDLLEYLSIVYNVPLDLLWLSSES